MSFLHLSEFSNLFLSLKLIIIWTFHPSFYFPRFYPSLLKISFFQSNITVLYRHKGLPVNLTNSFSASEETMALTRLNTREALTHFKIFFQSQTARTNNTFIEHVLISMFIYVSILSLQLCHCDFLIRYVWKKIIFYRNSIFIFIFDRDSLGNKTAKPSDKSSWVERCLKQ